MNFSIRTTLLYISILVLFGCTKVEDNPTEDELAFIDPIACIDQIYPEYTLDNVGHIYFSMYEYQDEYWHVWNCVFCNYISNAINCNQEALCETPVTDCMNEFYKDAVFLFNFSITE